jgi:hypothetical protein
LKTAKNDRFYREDKKLFTRGFDIPEKEPCTSWIPFTKLIRYRGTITTKSIVKPGAN